VACLINRARASDLDSFSAVFPGFDKDESSYISLVGAETGIRNHPVTPSFSNPEDDIVNLVKAVEEPFAGPSLFAQHQVLKLARGSGAIVLLNGQGSDELFAGYHYFIAYYLKGLLKRGRWASVVREMFHLIRGGHFSLALQALAFLLLPFRVRHRLLVRASAASKRLVGDRAAATGFFKDFMSLDGLHTALSFHLDRKLEQLLKWEDRNSMAHSTEVRVPFVDPDLMRFVFTLPEDFIIRQGRTKSVLRDALAGVVPSRILDRRDKIGFTVPEAAWLRLPTVQDLLDRWFVRATPRCAPYVDLGRLQRFIRRHREGGRDHSRTIWKVLFLEAWLRIYEGRFARTEEAQ
jgi:asparagine synthase (glutamine-hydrolysing)